MLIKGQDNCCIADLSTVSLRERHGEGGSWIDGNGRPMAHWMDKERAGAVMAEIWEAAKSGADFYELPGV